MNRLRSSRAVCFYLRTILFSKRSSDRSKAAWKPSVNVCDSQSLRSICGARDKKRVAAKGSKAPALTFRRMTTSLFTLHRLSLPAHRARAGAPLAARGAAQGWTESPALTLGRAFLAAWRRRGGIDWPRRRNILLLGPLAGRRSSLFTWPACTAPFFTPVLLALWTKHPVTAPLARSTRSGIQSGKTPVGGYKIATASARTFGRPASRDDSDASPGAQGRGRGARSQRRRGRRAGRLPWTDWAPEPAGELRSLSLARGRRPARATETGRGWRRERESADAARRRLR